MKDTEVLESFSNAWEAMCRQYKEYQREEMRVALNMLGKIIAKVKSEVEESHKESQITIDEWLAMINEGLEEKMNREIIFKAKRKDNGEWVEGYYVYCRKRHYILPVPNKAIGFDEREEEWIEINPDTLCQSTGLTDKNGKKIWENDIVYIRSNGISGYGVIKYQNGNLVLVDEKRKRTYSLYGEWKIRKDGNIFDNEDLLEAE